MRWCRTARWRSLLTSKAPTKCFPCAACGNRLKRWMGELYSFSNSLECLPFIGSHETKGALVFRVSDFCTFLSKVWMWKTWSSLNSRPGAVEDHTSPYWFPFCEMLELDSEENCSFYSNCLQFWKLQDFCFQWDRRQGEQKAGWKVNCYYGNAP